MTSKFVFLSDYDKDGLPNNLNIDPLNLTIGMGVPKSIFQTFTSTFLQDINKKLPESIKLPIAHPDWLRDGIVEITQDNAEVDITFITEGAGYTNSIGYYIYNKHKPPRTISDIKTIFIIFPNCSKINGGGKLKTGDTVKLSSEHIITLISGKHIANPTNYYFKKDTCIGFVILSNAYKASTNSLNKNTNKFYSNHVLNIETSDIKKYHTVLIKSIDDRIIIGFEDLRRDQNSDDDFNDVVLTCTVSPRTAINNYFVNDSETINAFGTILCEDRIVDTNALNNGYSDVIVEYNMTQKQENDMIKEIQMELSFKYRSTFYDHEFGLYIPNISSYLPKVKQELYYGFNDSTVLKDFKIVNDHLTIFESTKKALPASENHEHYANTHPNWELSPTKPTLTKIIMTFEKAIPKDTIKLKMPFNPYLTVWKSGTLGVDPTNVYTIYSNKKYPGATLYGLETVHKIIILDNLKNYQNSHEKIPITTTYPQILKYLQSNCTTDLTWYNNYREQYLNPSVLIANHNWSI